MVTLFAWMAQRRVSSKSWTRNASAASWRHSKAALWNLRPSLSRVTLMATSLTSRLKGILGMRSLVDFWNFLISRKATTPGRWRLGFGVAFFWGCFLGSGRFDGGDFGFPDELLELSPSSSPGVWAASFGFFDNPSFLFEDGPEESFLLYDFEVLRFTGWDPFRLVEEEVIFWAVVSGEFPPDDEPAFLAFVSLGSLVRLLMDLLDGPGVGFPPFCVFGGLLEDLFSLVLGFPLNGLLGPDSGPFLVVWLGRFKNPDESELVGDSSAMFEYNG